jgi:hypothetical protein
MRRMKLVSGGAIVSMLALACGGGGGSTDVGDEPDAPPAPDSASIDALAGDITVSLRRGHVPVPGAPVIGHDGDGAPIATATTDAAGDAVLPAAGVAMVTVIDTDNVSLFTATAVAPGDHIVIPTFTDYPDLGTLDVTVPALPPDAVSMRLAVGSCETGGADVAAPIALPLTAYCVGNTGTASVLALAMGELSDVVAVTTLTGVTPPAFGDTLAVALPAWSDGFDEFQLSVDGGDLGDLVNSVYGQDVDGVYFYLPSKSGNMPYTWWNPVPALGGFVSYSTQIPFGAPGPFGGTPAKRFFATRLPVGTLADAVELPADAMTGLLGTSVDTSELTRPVLGWQPDEPIDADGAIVKTRWFGAGYREWTFIMPSSQTSVRAPALPPDLAATWAPDAPVAQPYAVVVDTSYHDDYAGFRAEGFALAGGPTYLDDGAAELKGSVYFPAF